MRYSRSFFERPAYVVARELLGAELHHVIDGKELIGRIVETEAYDQSDQACHGYRGVTERTKPLFGHAGFSYVYFTYGMHWCFNVVTEKEGHGAAVLVRAVAPIAGIEEMRKRRKGITKDHELTSGPARLTLGMGIAKAENSIDLLESDILFLAKGKLAKGETVGVTTRIGITKDVELPWRFFIDGNKFVSRGKPSVLKAEE
ncbi:MAG TPA: DNA-3-methyladenine glycosylase [Candidatus Kapabacteria bacterium]|nr:DNA-3-methyladenine glycosylase [Candidatus Kapabacteria bacterium]